MRIYKRYIVIALVLLSPIILWAKGVDAQVANGSPANATPAKEVPAIMDFTKLGLGAGPLTPASVTPATGDLVLGGRQETPIVKRNDVNVPNINTGHLGELQPFGSQLFAKTNMIDRSIVVNNDYVIAPGDRIAIKIWGARTFQDVQSVDSQGNIFLPEIGSIRVGGVTNAALAGVVKGYVARVFTDNVHIYTNLLGTQPISVFVTGGVMQPGQYPGSKLDSILYYLSRAGAIDAARGSYRNLRVLRDGDVIANIDLYKFLLLGEMPKVEFKNNDTIIVGFRSTTVTVEGSVKNAYIFEFDVKNNLARDLLSMALPNERASHALIRGVRNGNKYSSYIPLAQLMSVQLQGGDVVRLTEDTATKNITVNVVGNSGGASSFVVPAETRLSQVARLIEVDQKVVDLKSIYIRRSSVAQIQKAAIQRSLYELQRSVLTGSSSSSTEASIRVQEANLVEKFVSRVSAVEPEGRVVLAGANWDLMVLEEGDEIVVPQLSDVILLSGEVKVPVTTFWKPAYSVNDYINEAGGISNRGDLNNILVLKRNGAVHDGRKLLEKGDHIVVLPKDDSKYFAMFKDIVEVVYRVAVSTAVVLNATK